MVYERMRELREDKGWTQQHVADLLFINRGTYSSYETGVRTMSPEILIKLAEIYQVSIDYLLSITDEKIPYQQSKNNFNK